MKQALNRLENFQKLEQDIVVEVEWVADMSKNWMDKVEENLLNP